MIRTGCSALLLAGVLATVSCGQSANDAAVPPSAQSADSLADCPDAKEDTSAPPLKALMATPEAWSLARSNRSVGDAFFVEHIGTETGQWVDAGCMSAWSHDEVDGGLVVHVFRFDTAEHAAEVWQRLRGTDGWDERYEIQGVTSVHVATAKMTEHAALHEAYRHVGRDLIVFALPGESISPRPNPALEQIVRHHVQQFPS